MGILRVSKLLKNKVIIIIILNWKFLECGMGCVVGESLKNKCPRLFETVTRSIHFFSIFLFLSLGFVKYKIFSILYISLNTPNHYSEAHIPHPHKKALPPLIFLISRSAYIQSRRRQRSPPAIRIV